MIEVKEKLQADVLIIGGGIAGLMAAIGAADKGADVVLLDKANTKRSGAGATGNDHFYAGYLKSTATSVLCMKNLWTAKTRQATTRPLSCVFWKQAPKS